MKTLLIKIGKAFTTMRREGVIKGGKRVFSAFFAMFRFVGRGDILFITGGVGDSALYRCHHTAEELEIHGFKCSITVQDNPFLPSYANKFNIFIFHRVLFTPSVAKLIKRAKQQKKEIIFETDDLVFDPKYLTHMDYFNQMNMFEKMLYENGVGGEILRDPYVKVCTTTTSYLADKLKEYDKKVFVSKNKLSNRDMEIANVILSERKRVEESNKNKIRSLDNARDDKIIKIGYFSGTLSHNKDFATIINALTRIMEKYPQVELFLAGPLDIENKLNKFKNRIKQFPRVSRDKYFENISQVDINLAPLEINNPFCEAKSELKWFEAGIVGVPTVVVKNRTFSEVIKDGVDGFLAGDTEEWVGKLEKLILDENLRREIGQKAREKSLQNYTNKNSHNEGYYNYLRQIIDK
ncbi:MAG: hypothetical protein A3J63_02690 [Candidatus Moranbacteria bacterium RIFCSPHIGHO2_02_FULL_40_12b]|nr:MAG: hypothetical protein A3J63_02690 [Candidatus Moranbacteria bacterium RIFCSPHIGHO2_02_FULL_40_12b]OGI24344.1 MAG: hypothetical protein A3E91_04015 [Candidatus Moranbacteria bacterium RIFCSPHIGHO2_12_FULL_40_10]